MVGLGIGCLDGASGRAGHWLSVWMGSVVGLGIGCLSGWGQW